MSSLQFKRGTLDNVMLDVPQSGEPVWALDTEQLYVGGILVGASDTFELTVTDSGSHEIWTDINATDFTTWGFPNTFIPVQKGDTVIINYGGDSIIYVGAPMDIGVGGTATVSVDFNHSYFTRTNNLVSSGQIAMNSQGYNLGDKVVITGYTIDGEAILGYEAAPLPTYTDGCQNNLDQFVSNDDTVSAWQSICDITLAQDIAGETVTAFWEVLLNNGDNKEGGYFEIGYGFNGATPTGVEHRGSVSADESTVFSGSTVALNIASGVIGDTLGLWIRGQGLKNTFDLNTGGSISPSKFLINVGDSTATPAYENPTTSIQSSSFSVTDSFDHVYVVDTAVVMVTIPTGLPQGHRFSVICMADTTFSTTGLVVLTPTSKILSPIEDGSMMGFVSDSLDSYRVFGDLA